MIVETCGDGGVLVVGMLTRSGGSIGGRQVNFIRRFAGVENRGIQAMGVSAYWRDVVAEERGGVLSSTRRTCRLCKGG